MMKRIRIVSVILLLTVFIASCSSATPTGQPEVELPRTEAEVPRVSVEEAFTAIQNGEAIVVDVRSAESYQASHVAGAMSIPLGQIETDLESVNLDKEQWIITYCT
jgi:3-mercaptopyruvate sulfurtransferase SseA